MTRTNTIFITACLLSACGSSSTTTVNQIGSDAGAIGGAANNGGAPASGGKSSSPSAGAANVGGKSTVGGTSTIGGTSSTATTLAIAGSTAAVGGATSTGGSAAIGGTSAAATGGVTSTSTSTGGTPGTSTGGTRTTTGGATAVGGAATGGAATGGAATGGAATGGKSATGGAATGGAATGGAPTGGAATGGMATGGSAADTTPPTVISVSPLKGTKGVTANTLITLNFSEPMDKASVASALTITGMVASDMSLSWNSAGTSLTITPLSGLAYATGQSPAITATTYTVTVGTGARDVVGNAMASAFSSNFQTLRRIKYDFSPSKVIVSDTYMNPQNNCADPLQIGGWSGSVSGGEDIAYLVFDVSPIGSASSLYAVESALLTGHQTSPQNNFYSISSVHVNKIQYDSSLYNIQSYPVLADVGILASSYAAVSSLETLTSFKADFVTQGVTNHMYTIAPTSPSSSWTAAGAHANFTCIGFYLTITYVIQ